MTKIAINKDYGGFSLSPQAIELLAKKNGIEKVYWFKSGFSASGHEYTPVDKPGNEMFIVAFSSPERSDETYIDQRPEKRDDPKLIEVIEELGPDVASGRYASIAVVEIPDDVEWGIEEYDGIEWIAEKHRTWS